MPLTILLAGAAPPSRAVVVAGRSPGFLDNVGCYFAPEKLFRWTRGFSL
jgi:hypothetical protein